MRPLNVLALNSGSSSLKFGVYRVDSTGPRKLLAESFSTTKTVDAMARVVNQLAGSGMPPPDAIGHRIVHGGARLRDHCRIDEAVLSQLEAAAAFAPLHAPAELALIRQAQAHFPGVPQVACLDTQFHAGLPDVARVLPIARELLTDGVHRYGFHGLSLESIVRQLGDELPQKLVIAHLGNGASITAVRSGVSIDTSMGLTPSGGIIMGTRSGDLDPGLLLYLMREKKFDAAVLGVLLDQHSGLLGVSGISSDMRRLHQAAARKPDAHLAIEMFCYSVRKQVAAMTAALGGLEMLVFTGGIGENDAQVRSDVCAGLAWIDVSLDASRNQAGANRISDGTSRVQVLVLASQEDLTIARSVWELLV